MAATVYVSESNGAGETVTESITNTNMGSTDAVNLVAATYPITPGQNSFEKWQRFKLSALGGSTKILNLQVWRTGSLSGSDAHKTNARTADYAGAETYAQPSASDRSATYHYTQTMPSSDPGAANLGIGGSLSGEATSAGAYSDYLVHQIQTNAGTVAGATCTMNYQYDEVA